VSGADAGALDAGLVEAAAGDPPEWDSLGRRSQ
jgi:hypothetical protein